MTNYPFVITACDPGCKNAEHNHVVVMEVTEGIDFSCHLEGDEMIIDRCKGVTPEEGLALFPSWALEALETF
jgi:hypothetical protein